MEYICNETFQLFVDGLIKLSMSQSNLITKYIKLLIIIYAEAVISNNEQIQEKITTFLKENENLFDVTLKGRDCLIKTLDYFMNQEN